MRFPTVLLVDPIGEFLDMPDLLRISSLCKECHKMIKKTDVGHTLGLPLVVRTTTCGLMVGGFEHPSVPFNGKKPFIDYLNIDLPMTNFLPVGVRSRNPCHVFQVEMTEESLLETPKMFHFNVNEHTYGSTLRLFFLHLYGLQIQEKVIMGICEYKNFRQPLIGVQFPNDDFFLVGPCFTDDARCLDIPILTVSQDSEYGIAHFTFFSVSPHDNKGF